MKNNLLPEQLATLLQVALHPEREDRPSFVGAAGEDLYALAARQGVLALAWDGLQILEREGLITAEQMPQRNLKLQWAYNVEQIEARYEKQRKTIAQLARFYTDHGIRMMLLKGYGLSLCYPKPKHRPCGDIDIWLYGEQQRADQLLCEKKGVKIRTDKHHHTIFHLNGILVENHYDFFNVYAHPSNREIERELQRLLVLKTGKEIEVEGIMCYLPSPNFNALFLLRHAAAHFAAEKIGLRQVADWALFVKHYHSQIDWPWLVQLAERQNMHRFLHCLCAIGIDFLGMDPAWVPIFDRDESLERRVLQDILTPEFSEKAERLGLIKSLYYKIRRWWANRWKHKIVYREGLIKTFLVQIWSHLLKPASLWQK